MVMMAMPESAPSAPATAAMAGAIGVCMVAQTNNVQILYPQIGAGQYFDLKKGPAVDLAEVEGAAIDVVTGPAHGKLQAGDGHFQYLSKKGYLGADKVVFVADVGGRQISVTYFLKVVREDVSGKNADKVYSKNCPKGEWLL